MEIERKFLINNLPFELNDYHFHLIEQAYLCTQPVVRIRKQDNDYYLTYKSKGFLAREEYNLPLTEESYLHLRDKADGNIITKKRYLIPYGKFTIELDIFKGKFDGMILAEVEFESEDEANDFVPPEWFGKDVTYSSKYHNSTLSQM
jgi:CYTH domain-containing protein